MHICTEEEKKDDVNQKGGISKEQELILREIYEDQTRGKDEKKYGEK